MNAELREASKLVMEKASNNEDEKQLKVGVFWVLKQRGLYPSYRDCRLLGSEGEPPRFESGRAPLIRCRS